LTFTLNSSGATIGFAEGPYGTTLDTQLHCTDDGVGIWIARQHAVKTGSVDRVEKM